MLGFDGTKAVTVADETRRTSPLFLLRFLLLSLLLFLRSHLSYWILHSVSSIDLAYLFFSHFEILEYFFVESFCVISKWEKKRYAKSIDETECNIQ